MYLKTFKVRGRFFQFRPPLQYWYTRKVLINSRTCYHCKLVYWGVIAQPCNFRNLVHSRSVIFCPSYPFLHSSIYHILTLLIFHSQVGRPKAATIEAQYWSPWQLAILSPFIFKAKLLVKYTNITYLLRKVALKIRD